MGKPYGCHLSRAGPGILALAAKRAAEKVLHGLRRSDWHCKGLRALCESEQKGCDENRSRQRYHVGRARLLGGVIAHLGTKLR